MRIKQQVQQVGGWNCEDERIKNPRASTPNFLF